MLTKDYTLEQIIDYFSTLRKPVRHSTTLGATSNHSSKHPSINITSTSNATTTTTTTTSEYYTLLKRIYNHINSTNPEMNEKGSYKIVPPQVMREGTKKTVFVNLLDICKRMKRPVEHLVQYLFVELGTQGSIDGTSRLVIKGRFQQKQIETVLKRYIVEYVSCKTCKSAETVLVKENRLYFVKCESCGSQRSVLTIKQGFVAQTGKRPKGE